MHEIEQKPAFEQSVVDAVDVLLNTPCKRGFVEQMSSLSNNDTEVRNRTLVEKMLVVTRQPVEVLVSRLLPPAIFAESVLASDEVIPRHHPAGHGLIHPHLCFF